MLIKRLQGQLEKRNGFYYEFDMHSKPLGDGGMGVVYKGFKIYEATGNRSVVAIKAMFDGLPAEVYERAEREASISISAILLLAPIILVGLTALSVEIRTNLSTPNFSQFDATLYVP